MATIKAGFDGDKEPDVILMMRGGGGVGKTSFIYRFLGDLPFTTIPPTLEDLYYFCYEKDGRKYKIGLYDTSGVTEFYKLYLKLFKVCDGIILISDPRLYDDYIIIMDLENIEKSQIPYVTIVNSHRSSNSEFDEKYITEKYMDNLKKTVKCPIYVSDPSDPNDCQCLDAFHNLLQQVIKSKQLQLDDSLKKHKTKKDKRNNKSL